VRSPLPRGSSEPPSTRRSGVRVRIRVEVEQELDVTSVLDGWTLDEVREFAAEQDTEGRAILATEGAIEWQDRQIEIRSSAISNYLAEREARDAVE
jgi:hypothetical protein